MARYRKAEKLSGDVFNSSWNSKRRNDFTAREKDSWYDCSSCLYPLVEKTSKKGNKYLTCIECGGFFDVKTGKEFKVKKQ